MSLDDWLRTLPDEYLWCRGHGHSWVLGSMFSIKGRGRRARLIDCSSCGTIRLDELEKNGEVAKRNYSYAKGYIKPQILPRIWRAEYTAELMRRVKNSPMPKEVEALFN